MNALQLLRPAAFLDRFIKWDALFDGPRYVARYPGLLSSHVDRYLRPQVFHPHPRLLDYGCGLWTNSVYWSQLGKPRRLWDVTGVCLTEREHRRAVDQSTHLGGQARYVLCRSTLQQAVGDVGFGLAMDFNVFIHLSDAERVAYAAAFAQLVDVGGYLMVTTWEAADMDLCRSAWCPAGGHAIDVFAPQFKHVLSTGTYRHDHCCAWHVLKRCSDDLGGGTDERSVPALPSRARATPQGRVPAVPA